MQVRGCINIPEPFFSPPPPPFASTEEGQTEPPAFSPTDSEDSGRWTGTSVWPSSKYFVHGGPGFSIGLLDSTNGSLERLPISVPTISFLEAGIDADASNFSLSEVTCLALAGEAQVWAGTEAGSLHVFDLSSAQQCGSHHRLLNHGYSKLPEAVSCLRAEQLTSPPSGGGREASWFAREKRSLARTEVLVGSTGSDSLTIISGEADERGGLRNVARCPRKVVHLRAHSGTGSGVHCFALTCGGTAGLVEERYWCGCETSIVVLRRSNWQVLKELEQADGLPAGGCVSQLESTEHGVWCSVQHSPTVVLWDAKTFAATLKISCFNAGPEVPLLETKNAQVTCLAYCDPLLLVGTRGGCLLVLSIHHKQQQQLRTRHTSVPNVPLHAISSREHRGRRLTYTVLASSQCCPRPITSIHPVGGSLGGSGESPYLASPNNGLNMMVVFGKSEEDSDSHGLTECVVHVYEVSSSPLGSPVTSPQTTPGGRLSTVSVRSLPPSVTPTARLQDMDNMPRLSLHRVSNEAISYLPLH